MGNKNIRIVVELFLGISGIVLTLIFHNQWSFVPIILWGVIASLFIRREISETLSSEERSSVKRRNIVLFLCWVLAAIICYYAANETLKANGLWFLLSAYLFLSMHGLVFAFPIGFFPNEKNKNVKP